MIILDAIDLTIAVGNIEKVEWHQPATETLLRQPPAHPGLVIVWPTVDPHGFELVAATGAMTSSSNQPSKNVGPSSTSQGSGATGASSPSQGGNTMTSSRNSSPGMGAAGNGSGAKPKK